MASGPLPPPPGPTPPPGCPVPPRPDLAPAGRPPAAVEPRRRSRARVVVATIVVASVVLAAIGSLADLPHSRNLAVETNHDYRFLQQLPDGRPYRWDPCVPIHYEVNLAGAPDGALDDVRQAIARTAEASGYRFAFDGTTVRTVDQQMDRSFQSAAATTSRWLPLLIAWVPHAHFDYLAETHRAAAFGMPRVGDGQDFATYESGLVALDAGGGLPAGFGERYSDGVVLMHELGHVLGLGHVAAGDELMYSPDVRGAARPPDLSQNDWGPGDRHGLEILGSHGPCPVPSHPANPSSG